MRAPCRRSSADDSTGPRKTCLKATRTGKGAGGDAVACADGAKCTSGDDEMGPGGPDRSGLVATGTVPDTSAPELHILWINAGLSCDGDSVAVTSATQPSIEEIVLGALPGLPKVAVHWPLIDYECGPDKGADTFIEWFFKADRGELDPFVLVVEGSIPNEAIKSEGYWCGFGNNPETGQPMTTSEWLDRLTPNALGG